MVAKSTSMVLAKMLVITFTDVGVKRPRLEITEPHSGWAIATPRKRPDMRVE
jgi:hypothetical protein